MSWEAIKDLVRNFFEGVKAPGDAAKVVVPVEVQGSGLGASLATQATLASVAARVAPAGMLILTQGQLAATVGGIYEAELFAMPVLPTAGRTFVVKVGSTVETFTFVASKVLDFDVEIAAGDIPTTLTNLLAEIFARSALVAANTLSGLDAYFGVTTANQFYLRSKLTTSTALRCYGTEVAIKAVKFGYNNDADYSADCSIASDLPATDPGAKQFGPARSTVLDGERHYSVADGIEYTWDATAAKWLVSALSADPATQATLAALLPGVAQPCAVAPVVITLSDGNSAQSAALPAGLYVITSSIDVAFSEPGANPTATAAGHKLWEKTYRWLKIGTANHKVAALILNTGETGTVTLDFQAPL